MSLAPRCIYQVWMRICTPAVLAPLSGLFGVARLRLDVSGVHVEIQGLSASSGVYANWGWKDVKWRRGHSCFLFAFLCAGWCL